MDGVHVARLSSNCRPAAGGLSPDENTPVGKAPSQVPVKKQAVKRHHHKHNLKHRYEFLETLGKGTYGKVKKAKERSGRLVSIDINLLLSLFYYVTLLHGLYGRWPHLQSALSPCLLYCPIGHLLFRHRVLFLDESAHRHRYPTFEFELNLPYRIGFKFLPVKKELVSHNPEL